MDPLLDKTDAGVQAHIDAILRKHYDDLWLNLRLDPAALLGPLEQLLADTTRNKEIVHDWLRFVRFLADSCSGQWFQSDKQWSQLLDLMQISRKFNQRSLRFRDIVRGKQLIEANSASIRRLNERAQLSCTLTATLSKIDKNLQACQLELDSGNDTKPAGGTSLLRELTRLGDYLQSSCLATIRNAELELAAFASGGGGDSDDVQTKSWQTRLDEQLALATRMAEFAERLVGLQANMAQLKPLVSAIKTTDATGGANRSDAPSAGFNSHRLNNKFDTCKQEFKLVLQFHAELIKYLAVASSKAAPLRVPPSDASQPGRLDLVDRKPSSPGTRSAVQLARMFRADTRPVDKLLAGGLSDALERSVQCLKLIDEITASLRLEFGRFYFVNDLELLQIISLDCQLVEDCREPANRQLICKLFSGSIGAFLLHQGAIVGVESPLGERVEFFGEKPIVLRKAVNIYSVEIVRILVEVLRKLPRTLRNLLGQHCATVQTDCLATKIDWRLPLQLVNLSQQIGFTREVEQVLLGVQDFAEGARELDQLIASIESRSKQWIADSLGEDLVELNQVDRLKRSAAISMNVQFVSCLLRLRKHSQRQQQLWAWFSWPRFYAKLTGGEHELEVVVQIGLAQFQYKFDFLPTPVVPAGSSSAAPTPIEFKRLIATPSSDACFLVAAQAIAGLRMGASPYGPAGSGKTETVKALGRLVGCQVIVHNCDETNDLRSLNRLVWGLAHTGLWGCFDEFNRLSLSSLSGVSATLGLVQTNLKLNRRTIELKAGEDYDDDDGSGGHEQRPVAVSIDPDVAFFVTMNPSDGLRYRGRRQLPANLRSLFLPISMCRFHIEPIVFETLLSIGGRRRPTADMALQLSNQLARWLHWTRTNWPSIKLRPANKCEWDLRLVVAILRRFRTELLLPSDEASLNRLMAHAIREHMAPRLSSGEREQLLDCGLAQAFGFSEVGCGWATTRADKQVEKSVELDECSPEERDFLLEKMGQLESQLRFEPGAILLGPSSSLKSLTWQRLAARSSGTVRSLVVLSPKCCRNQAELVGFVNPLSQKWLDGLLTGLVRESLQLLTTADHEHGDNECNDELKPPQQVWLVLDGPIDPDWIECLNSALDDNQVLTLASGERLSFQPAPGKSVKLILETSSIEFASPATISRLGLVYYDDVVCNSMMAARLRRLSPQQAGVSLAEPGREQVALNNVQLLGANCNKLASAALVVEKFCTNGATNCKRLLILVGGAAADYTCSSAFRNAALAAANAKRVFEYNCHELSHSAHLIDFISSCLAGAAKPRSARLFVVRNLHLIDQEEPNWRTRTLLELLRFMATYEFLYDTRLQDQPVGNRRVSLDRCKFVLTVDSLDSLDARLVSQANLSAITDAEAQSVRGELSRSELPIEEHDCKFWSGEPQVRELFVDSQRTGVVSILINCNERQLDTLLAGASFRELALHCKQFKFNNTAQVAASLERLARVATQTRATRTEANRRRTLDLFVLNQHEFELMAEASRARLFHLLNVLQETETRTRRAASSAVKLVYLAREPLAQAWRPFGASLRLKYARDRLCNSAALEQLLSQSLTDSARFSFNNSEELSDFPLTRWLAEAIESLDLLACVGYLAENPVALVGQFVGSLLELLNKSWLSLSSARKEFSVGLSCLGKFDASVEQLRKQHKLKSAELEELQKSTAKLIVNLDEQVRQSEAKRHQLEQLRVEQAARRATLGERSELVERELGVVKPALEASRRQVSEQLANPEALNEVKSLRVPPKSIEQMLKILLMILHGHEQRRETNWPEMRQFLARRSLRDELLNFDHRRRLDANLVHRVQQEMSRSAGMVSREQAARASAAMVPILGWIEASLRYGQALTRLQPLDNELRELQSELERQEAILGALASDQSSIERVLDEQRLELTRAKQQINELAQRSEQIKSQLVESEALRTNLARQIERWQEQLATVESLLEPGRLVKLCLASVCLVFSKTRQVFHSRLDELLQRAAGERKLASKQQFLAQMFRLVDADVQQWSPDANDANDHLLDLLRIKLGFQLTNATLVLNQETVEHDDDELLLGQLASGRILCESASDAIIFSANRIASVAKFANLVDEIRHQQRQRGLILLELSGTEVDLDVADFVASSSERKFLLLNRRRQAAQPTFGEQLTTSIKLNSPGSANDKNCATSALRDKLIEQFVQLEAQTGAEDAAGSWERQKRLTEEMRAKQLELSSADARLLQQLKSVAREGFAGEPSGQLVGILSESRRLQANLETCLADMAASLRQLENQRDKFAPIAQIGAEFYQHFLAELRGFSRFPVDQYAQTVWLLLNPPAGRHDNSGGSFTQLLAGAMRPMEPAARRRFAASLSQANTERAAVVESMFQVCSPNYSSNTGNSSGIGSREPLNTRRATRTASSFAGNQNGRRSNVQTAISGASTRAADLRQTLLELLVTMRQAVGLGNKHEPQAGDLEREHFKLMIVLHDSRRASPLGEFDELLGESRQRLALAEHLTQQWRARGVDLTSNGLATIEYHKLFATTGADLFGQSLGSLLADNPADRRKCLKVVCIANAPLASEWLQTRLLETIRESGQLALVVLLAESTPGAEDACELGSLFEAAHSRYWHDESALSLVDRHDLLLSANNRAHFCGLKLMQAEHANKKVTQQQMDTVLGGLVLFHVVCQELSFAGSLKLNLDANQLSLAIKLFGQLLKHNERQWKELTGSANSILNSLCRQLAAIVYGARLEAPEDEQRLDRLIEQFLGSFEAIERKLEIFERLAASSRLHDNQSAYRELLETLLKLEDVPDL